MRSCAFHACRPADRHRRRGTARRQVAARLDPARFESVLCASRRTDEPLLDRELAEAGIEVLALDRGSKLDLRAWRPLVRQLRDGVDVVHAHMFGSNVWGTVLGRLTRVPVVVAHEHTWSFQGRPFAASSTASWSAAGRRLRRRPARTAGR